MVLLLCSCSAAPSVSSSFESEHAPVYSYEELKAIKEDVLEKWPSMAIPVVTQAQLQKIKEDYKNGEYDSFKTECIEELMPDIRVKEVIASAPESEVYHPVTIVSALKSGMFINEVQKILGQPHFGAYAVAMSHIDLEGRFLYDYYTFYVLNDGRVLELHFLPVIIGDYDRELLSEQIPQFDHYEEYLKQGIFMNWGKLLSATILTPEELYKKSYMPKDLETDDCHLPKIVDLEDLQKIHVGMTYEDVKKLVGNGGLDLGKHSYLWNYPSNTSGYRLGFVVDFVKTESGELIVSKIGA
jgi:outer membrane protein assembly factor BamE (lipoprotein component of BamABCDE complex)